MVSKKLEKALNKQVQLEAEASFAYLAMASWCEKEGLNGCAKFFYGHAEEERQHMLKIFQYLNEIEGHAIVPKLEQPQLEFKSISDAIETAMKSEQEVTKAVNELYELAEKEKDYGTYKFVEFYVNEQREEEILFSQITEKIKLIGFEGMGLYYIDKELENFSAVHG